MLMMHVWVYLMYRSLHLIFAFTWLFAVRLSSDCVRVSPRCHLSVWVDASCMPSHDAIKLPGCCYSLHCALGLPGRPVVVEHFSASLRRIRTSKQTGHQKPQTLRQRRRRHPHLQTELVTSSCMPFDSRVPVPGRTA